MLPFEQEAKAEYYSVKWKLYNLKLIYRNKYSCIFACISELYGPSILKMLTNKAEIISEYLTLKEYSGQHFCKIYDCDFENGVLLEEQIIPGTELKEVTELSEKIQIFCSCYEKLHKKADETDKFRTYLDWVNRISAYMDNRHDYSELAVHMKKAEQLCLNLFACYPETVLLHGDLHHHNILKNHSGDYTIIDPKGILGPRIFDLPRFILNELEGPITPLLFEKINYVIEVISTRLSIPLDTIRKCFYIETAMTECWNVESGNEAFLENVLFAEKLMNLSGNTGGNV